MQRWPHSVPVPLHCALLGQAVRAGSSARGDVLVQAQACALMLGIHSSDLLRRLQFAYYGTASLPQDRGGKGPGHGGGGDTQHPGARHALNLVRDIVAALRTLVADLLHALLEVAVLRLLDEAVAAHRDLVEVLPGQCWRNALEDSRCRSVAGTPPAHSSTSGRGSRRRSPCRLRLARR